EGGERFETCRIFGIEAVGDRGIEIEHADERRSSDEGYDDLGARGGIAGNVTGEGVYVWHHDGLAPCRSGAAYTLAQGNAHAGGLALEWSQDKLAVFQEVEARPVEVDEAEADQGREVRRIGDRIALALEQALRLQNELAIDLGLGAGRLLGREGRHFDSGS